MDTARPQKAVVLARGLGTRMRRAAEDAGLSEGQRQVAASGLKAMMPMATGGDAPAAPFLDYVITALADAGLTDICLVIGPEHQVVRDYYGGLSPSRVTISFAVQDQPLGTADAVAAAREFAGMQRFVVVNSDNYYPVEALRALVAAPGTATVGFEVATMVAQSNIPAERIAAFALLDVDAEGHLRDILEKPDPALVAARGEHALVSMNCFLFGPTIFEACARLQPSARGEYEIVDAIRAVAATGEPVDVVPVRAGVLDMSGRADVPAVVAALASRRVAL